jgi:hypothetical protein
VGTVFFRMNTVLLAVVLTVIIGGVAAAGLAAGRLIRARSDSHRESVGVVQGALLGFVGLLLAFGLTMAVGRYDNRRALVVQEANDIGTTYLRAQLLDEPARSTSLELLRRYADEAVDLTGQVPDSARYRADLATMADIQRDLWAAASDAVDADPVGSAPRLYVESLNAMIDSNAARAASLVNRVPPTIMVLTVFGSAVALGLLSLYLALIGRGAITAGAAALVIILIVFISFDLDRPERGFITVPAGPLLDVQASMDEPPAATP